MEFCAAGGANSLTKSGVEYEPIIPGDVNVTAGGAAAGDGSVPGFVPYVEVTVGAAAGGLSGRGAALELSRAEKLNQSVAPSWRSGGRTTAGRRRSRCHQRKSGSASRECCCRR